MKIITNKIVEKASGKLGTSIVLYQNAARQCARMYVIPTNRQSPLQLLCRTAMSTASQWWSTILSDSDRQAWNEFAGQISERTGQLGLKYRRTGQQLATASAQLAGLTGAASSLYELPINPIAVPSPLSATASYDISSATLTLTMTYPTIANTMEAIALPRLLITTSAAQTPTLAKSRLLLSDAATFVAYQDLDTGGVKGPVTYTAAIYPALAQIATATEAYLFITTRAANSGLENEIPFRIPVSIIP